MYNTDFPDRADLPSSEKLVFSTIIAGIIALVILVTIVLPSEYGFDVTGIGRVTGLTQMGEIKMQLAEEAAAADLLSQQVAAGTAPIMTSAAPLPSAELAALSARAAALEQVLGPAQPAPQQTAAAPAPVAAPLPSIAPAAPATETVVASIPTGPQWRDEVTFVLTPMQGTEYKLVMDAGAVANFEVIVNGGVVNYDAHGEGNGQSVTYNQVRGITGDTGRLTPPFTGTHGWFFRNRGNSDVTVTLRTSGQYLELRKIS